MRRPSWRDHHRDRTASKGKVCDQTKLDYRELRRRCQVGEIEWRHQRLGALQARKWFASPQALQEPPASLPQTQLPRKGNRPKDRGTGLHLHPDLVLCGSMLAIRLVALLQARMALLAQGKLLPDEIQMQTTPQHQRNRIWFTRQRYRWADSRSAGQRQKRPEHMDQ